MDGDGEKPFDVHSLSFDSTFESLLEVDFALEAKDPPCGLPTESAMSDPVKNGTDLSSVEDGPSDMEVKHEQIKELGALDTDTIESSSGMVGTNSEMLCNSVDVKMEQEDIKRISLSNVEMAEEITDIDNKEHEEDMDISNNDILVDPNNDILVDSTSVQVNEKVQENVKETNKNSEKYETNTVKSESVVGTIASLNLDELKAKRKRKLEEDKSGNVPLVESSNDIQRKNTATMQDDSSSAIPGKRKFEGAKEEKDQLPSKSCKNETEDVQAYKEKFQKEIGKEDSSSNFGNNETNTDITDTSKSGVEDSMNSVELADVISSNDSCNTESLNDTLTGNNAEAKDGETLFEFDDINKDNGDEENETFEGLTDRDEDNNDENADYDSSDIDLDENEIEAMLDEGLNVKDSEEKTEKTEHDLKPGEFIAREKLVLEEKDTSVFEVLPPGWIQVAHACGMYVYLHRESRVCTMSKPYSIGKLGVRRHDIPLSAIPCLQYRRALEKEKEKEAAKICTEAESQEQKAKADQETNGKPTENCPKLPSMMPQPVVESAEKTVMLNSTELNEYCKSLFQFRSLVVKKFRTWKEKRIHLLEEKRKQLPGLPSNTRLITCPVPENSDNKTKKRKKNFVLNPVGKTPVCILHEYTQHVLMVQPTYEFKEIENAESPYKATVLIDGIQYGFGVASSKRQAKANAAQATLEVFMPQLAKQWKKDKPASQFSQSTDLSYFEDVVIEDPRVVDLCDKAALPKPYEVLVECLRRNFGLGDTNLAMDKKMVGNQRTEFSFTVGKHTAKVVCRNKRDGKQRAAQAMLQILHPNLRSWAAILRLYSRNTEQGFKEREEERAALAAQVPTEKNFEILDQLKEAMRKIRAQKEEQAKTKASIQSNIQPLDL